MFRFSQKNLDPILQVTHAEDLLLAGKYYEYVQELKKAPNDESKVVAVQVFQDFVTLSNTERYSSLTLLGHFALIEALITHDPHKFGDSLNHQLSTKMPLLMRRWPCPLDPACFFPIQDLRTVWKRLYELRSIIAHGGKPDFTKNRLRDLRSGYAAYQFVRAALKRLIIQTFHEPQLVNDLKAC